MESLDKYYTPDVSEIFIGFELEIKSKDKWNKRIVDQGDISNILYDISAYEGKLILSGVDRGQLMSKEEADFRNSIIRVKYLDIEDTESLGWKFQHSENDFRSVFYFDYDDLQLLYSDSKSRNIDIYLRKNVIFRGTIKNKSELRKLMQMLNIIE